MKLLIAGFVKGIRVIVNVLGSVWLLGWILMVPVYNYQFAQSHGFVEWLMLGEFAPTFKGIGWPYFVYADHKASQDKEIKLAYWKAFDGCSTSDPNSEYSSVMRGRVEERRKIGDEHGADRLLAEELEHTISGSQKGLLAMEAIKPSDCYRQLHLDMLDLLRAEISLFKRWAAACRSFDQRRIERCANEQDEITKTSVPIFTRVLKERKLVEGGQ